MMVKRITMFGLPGAGKSTFANQLGRELRIPVHHLDVYFFRENWEEVGHEIFFPKLQDLIAEDHWIIDGNCLSTIEHRFQRAEVIIYFRYSRFLCLWRIFKRRLLSNPFQDKRDDCPSKVTWALMKFLWTFYKLREPSLLRSLEKYKDRQIYLVTNDRELAGVRAKLVA